MAGASGKYWNVGFSDTTQAGATERQLRYLRSLYGRDFRGKGLTQGQANKLIEDGIEAKSNERDGVTNITDQLFSHLMRKAIKAANEAGDAWLSQHPDPLFYIKNKDNNIPVHGMVGTAYITAPKKSSGLGKWLRANDLHDARNTKELSIHHKYSERLEAELQLACCDAALTVLRESTSEIGDLRIIFKCDRENFKLAG